LAKITTEFSSFKESLRSFLLVSRVSDQFYESRLAKNTSGTPLSLLNSSYGGRTYRLKGHNKERVCTGQPERLGKRQICQIDGIISN
ncbi:hypothetical protein TSAR_009284, partial [Trichomalopsis sarcophagae]